MHSKNTQIGGWEGGGCSHWSLSTVWWTVLTLLEETRLSVVDYDEYWLLDERPYEKKKWFDTQIWIIQFFFPDLSDKEAWTRKEWRRWREVTDSTETTWRSSMKLGDREELSPKWCSKPVFCVCSVRKITQPCILYLTYTMFTQLNCVVFISHSYRLYNSPYLKRTLKL